MGPKKILLSYMGYRKHTYIHYLHIIQNNKIFKNVHRKITEMKQNLRQTI